VNAFVQQRQRLIEGRRLKQFSREDQIYSPLVDEDGGIVANAVLGRTDEEERKEIIGDFDNFIADIPSDSEQPEASRRRPRTADPKLK
jgi:hypothetical protein